MRQLSITILLFLLVGTAFASLTPYYVILAPHFLSLDGVSYQFRGTSPSGGPIPDGAHVLDFEIWDDPTGGMMLWSESQTVVTEGGLGSVRLGSVVNIPLDIFGVMYGDMTKALYLQVMLDGEMITPRTRLVPTPYSHISERILGDVQTSEGHLVVSNIGSSGEDGVTIGADPGSAEVKVGIESDDLGIRMHASDDGSGAGLSLSDTGTTGEALIHMGTYDATGSHLVVANIGSSGQDGMEIEAGPGTTEVKLGIDSEDLGMRMHASDDGSGVGISLSDTGTASESIIDLSTFAETGSHLAVANISSAGMDGYEGLDITAGEGATEVKLGIEHEDIGASLRASDDGSGVGLSLSDTGTVSEASIRMNAQEAGGSNLTVSNIGSSGEDGVSIELDSTGGGLFMRHKSARGFIPIEIVALSLSSTEPVMAFRSHMAGPTDPPTLRYEYDALGRLTRTTTSPPTQPGDSSKTTATGFRVFDGTLRFELDNLGVRAFDVSSGQSPFRLEANGDMSNQGACMLATLPTSNVVIGSSVPPTFKLNVDGVVCADNFASCSDARFKKDVSPIEGPLNKVSRLQGINFYWKSEDYPEREFSNERQIGFIAQDLEKVLPEAVVKGSDGYYTVDYGRITPLLVEAIKEQEQTIDDLRRRVTELESLQAQLTVLQEAVRHLQENSDDQTGGNSELAGNAISERR
jgi:hypothetical protein